MGLVIKETGQNIDPVPEAVHQAICYAVYDLGTHFDEKFKKHNRKIVIIWELPEERIVLEKDGEKRNLPRAISKKYTASLSEKATLRKDLQSWRGRAFTDEELQGFDIAKLLGVNCMLQVIHTKKDQKTYANISTVIPLIKGMPKREAENPLVYFNLEEGTGIPEATPDWIKEIIMDSEEWKHRAPSEGQPPPDDDDVPF